MHWLRIRFPDIRQTSKRLFLLALSHITLVSLTYIVLFYSYDELKFLDYQLDWKQLKLALYSGIGLNIISTTMW
jgi:hypothetical protein